MRFLQVHLWKTKKANYLRHLDGIELAPSGGRFEHEKLKCVQYPSVFLLMDKLCLSCNHIFESNFEVARKF